MGTYVTVREDADVEAMKMAYLATMYEPDLRSMSLPETDRKAIEEMGDNVLDMAAYLAGKISIKDMFEADSLYVDSDPKDSAGTYELSYNDGCSYGFPDELESRMIAIAPYLEDGSYMDIHCDEDGGWDTYLSVSAGRIDIGRVLTNED